MRSPARSTCRNGRDHRFTTRSRSSRPIGPLARCTCQSRTPRARRTSRRAARRSPPDRSQRCRRSSRRPDPPDTRSRAARSGSRRQASAPAAARGCARASSAQMISPRRLTRPATCAAAPATRRSCVSRATSRSRCQRQAVQLRAQEEPEIRLAFALVVRSAGSLRRRGHRPRYNLNSLMRVLNWSASTLSSPTDAADCFMPAAASLVTTATSRMVWTICSLALCCCCVASVICRIACGRAIDHLDDLLEAAARAGGERHAAFHFLDALFGGQHRRVRRRLNLADDRLDFLRGIARALGQPADFARPPPQSACRARRPPPIRSRR